MTEPAVDQTQDAPNEPAGNGRDYESEASKMGWVSQDQFRGDPEKHISAEEYVKRGETKIPLMLAAQRRQADEIASLKKSMAFQSDMHERNLKDQNDRLRKELADEMRSAVSEGDTERYAAAEKKRDDIKDPEPAPRVDEKPAAIVQFEADNDWYGSNSSMTVVANAESQRLSKERPEMTLEQNLAAVQRHIKAEFPHKFGNPRRDEPAAVGGAKKGGKGSAKSFGNLPQEAKDAFKTFHRDGVFGKKTSEADAQKAYVSSYQWED